MLATANFGAIREQPGAFLGTALRGTTRQFFAFAVLDDECPANCQDDSSVLVRTLRQYLPHGLPAFLASPQADERFPRRLMMLATTPIAMAAMLLAGLALITAIRRRDAAMASLLAAITACLLVNAAMAGSLSDVHDRYQSRLIWLLPFVVMLAWRRWRPIADATPSGPSRLMPAGQDRPMLEI